MRAHALSPQNSTKKASYEVQKAFARNIALIPGPDVTLDVRNCTKAPPLSFRFVSANVLGAVAAGRAKTFSEIYVGCGSVKDDKGRSCNPHMGQDIGCEYSRVCECLEFAPVDETRMSDAEREDGYDPADTMGLPKKFPYSSPNSRRPGCLDGFYLKKRNFIWECNPRCACGAKCKTRVVQHGRKVPLEIFWAGLRGFGLRCPVDLARGQFIDTYRGEVITDAEADRRQQNGAKNSYMYDLDKHDDGEDADKPRFVIDGQHVGGPARFMNHSCMPNCGQFCVSWNKNNDEIYELALFAIEDIPAGTELTFDYLDEDPEDEDDEDEGGGSEKKRDEDGDEMPEGSVRCLCGAARCRKWLTI